MLRSYQIAQFGQPLKPSEAPLPDPKGREVLVRVEHCGVCHSDIHIWDGYFDLGNGRKVVAANNGALLPLTPGHEIVGSVAAVGPAARTAQPGQRRLVFPWIGCGTCPPCRDGNEHICAGAQQAIGIFRDGGYATHVLVPDERYLVDYGSLDPLLASTYACSGLTAYSALKKIGRLADHHSLLIVGAGGVGLNGVALAKAVTGQAPIVADIDPTKREAALRLGARSVIDPREDGTLKALLKETGGVMAAVDFAGSGPSFEFAYGSLRKGGHLVSVGLLGGAATLSLGIHVMKALRVSGSYVGSLAELQELIALAQTTELPGLPITEKPLAQATEALQALKDGRVVGRIVLDA
ncbi:MAG TPA: alcohol dehydrogenase [Ferrovibrio sp.]|jgi:D-arabinose 1-dehydrogenase-like Zn-dependent alcohol dehydrogenase|uniref:alcohol dehydrogenase n=1 Tax=Ferrovibrio sp. TaxID=1917215 RepID=UPI002B4B0D33|nr:alcohol dehydrogenase [Ferrovibrio sp.]HLT75847.1 alcohol dehydrogenase [Ferrovibrio sp.]